MTLLNTAFTWFSEQGYCFRTGLRGWLEVSSPLGWLPSAPQAVKENLSVITQPLTEHLVSARLRDTEQEERERERHADMVQHIQEGVSGWRMLKWTVSFPAQRAVRTLIRIYRKLVSSRLVLTD